MTNKDVLEQQIFDCWRITEDIPMMEAQGAGVADMTSLACVYEFKFRQLYATWEQLMVEERAAK